MDLTDANINDANLTNVDLTDPILTDVNLTDAILTDANNFELKTFLAMLLAPAIESSTAELSIARKSIFLYIVYEIHFIEIGT